MPLINLVGALDPKAGIELAFTNKGLIDEISKEKFASTLWPREEIASYVVSWIQAVLSTDLQSTLAPAHKVVEITALDHQHGDVCPYYKAFDWEIIRTLENYQKNAIFERNSARVSFLVDDDIQDADDPNKVDGDLAGRIRISYDWKNGNTKPWYWDITLDHGCFEIQTCPMPISNFNDFAFSIVEQHIMGGANKIGLTDRSGMGGMQVNIDFATGLSDDYLLVLRAIVATEHMKRDFRLRSRKDGTLSLALTGDPAYNAAYISEDGRPPELAQHLGALIRSLVDTHRTNPGAFARDAWLSGFFKVYRFLMRRYPTDMQLTQLSKDFPRSHLEKKVSLEDDFEKQAPYNEEIERFQALNITNILDTTAAHRRVEFRDFFATYDIDDFAAVIAHVYGILVVARARHAVQEQEKL